MATSGLKAGKMPVVEERRAQQLIPNQGEE